MRVLVAGATGALGMPAVRALTAAGHEVTALSRRAARSVALRELGVRTVTTDVLDRARLLRAVDGLRTDAVLDLATAFSRAPLRHRDMEPTDTIRTTGNANLLAAAHAVGARRFVAESMIFGYGYGDWGERVLREDDPPFGPPGRTPGLGRHLAAMRTKERQTLHAPGIEGIALRYGAFYGPGASDAVVDLLRRRRLPVTRPRTTLSLVHIEDAAAATVAALERGRPGRAYNVVDDEPALWADFLTELAGAHGAPPPRTLPAWTLAPLPYAHDVVTTSMRVSNDRIRAELGWVPGVPTYREGLRRLVGRTLS